MGIKTGLIGAGGRGVFLGGLLYKIRGAELIGIAEISQEIREKARETFGGDVKIFNHHKRILEDKQIEAVIIATPDWTHYKICADALMAGKHVFCEKPLGITASQAKNLVALAKNKKRILAVGFCFRFVSIFKKTKEIIESGRLGNVQFIQATYFRPAGSGFFRGWHRFRKNSGGLLVHKGCHIFDLISWFLSSNPVKVSAVGGLNVFKPVKKAGIRCSECSLKMRCPEYSEKQMNLCVFNSDKDTFDNTFTLIEYENGSRATYASSFFTPHCIEFVISGDKGTLRAEWISRKVKRVFNLYIEERYTDRAISYNVNPNTKPPEIDELKEFFKAIRGQKTKYLAFGKDGYIATLLGECAENSVRSNRTIILKQDYSYKLPILF